MTKIGFIGSGNMAFALMKAVKPLSTKITASDVKKERLDYIKKEIGAEVTTDNSEVVKRSNIIFLAVKPQKMADVLEQIKGNLKDQIIISIAAGITMSFIKSKLNYNKVVRVMPNTPCLVGEMAAGFAIDYLSDKEVLLVEKILNSAGKAFLLKEEDLDAVTGLSGSGPAFVARLIEAFTEAGIKQGLGKDIAAELAIQTFKGTAKLLQDTGMSPDELVKMVSSPNGTTVAGREILESSDYKEIIINTVKKATQRSKELGK